MKVYFNFLGWRGECGGSFSQMNNLRVGGNWEELRSLVVSHSLITLSLFLSLSAQDVRILELFVATEGRRLSIVVRG